MPPLLIIYGNPLSFHELFLTLFRLFTQPTTNTIVNPREFYFYYCKADRTFSPFALAAQHIGRIPFSLAPVSEREDSRANLHHPRVASVLGVARCYHVPLIFCRGLSVWPSLIGLSRCAVAFVATEGLGCTQVELILAVIWVRTVKPSHFPPIISRAYDDDDEVGVAVLFLGLSFLSVHK